LELAIHLLDCMHSWWAQLTSKQLCSMSLNGNTENDQYIQYIPFCRWLTDVVNLCHSCRAFCVHIAECVFFLHSAEFISFETYAFRTILSNNEDIVSGVRHCVGLII